MVRIKNPCPFCGSRRIKKITQFSVNGKRDALLCKKCKRTLTWKDYVNWEEMSYGK